MQDEDVGLDQGGVQQIIGQQFHPACRLLHLHQILQVRRPLLLEPPMQKLAEALQDCQRRLELVRGHCQECIFGGHGRHQFACARLNHLLQGPGILYQRPSLLRELPAHLVRLNGAMQGGYDVVTIDGLLNEVVGSPSQSLNSEIVFAMTGNQQGRRLGPHLLDA